MKRTNVDLNSLLRGAGRWHGVNMGIMRSAWSLYRAVAGRTALVAGVLLVTPYALLVLLTMRAVSFDMGRAMQLLTGVGYTGDWAGMIVGRLQALSSLNSLISYATDLFLLPCACAAFALIFAMRWQGHTLSMRSVWERIRPLIGRIIIAGLSVMFLFNFVEMASGIITGLLSMVASLVGFIPVVGGIVYGVVYAVSLLVVLAIELLAIAVLMFAMLLMTSGEGPRGQLAMNTARLLWGGRRDTLPSLGWLLMCSAVVLVLGAAVYGLMLAMAGPTAAVVITLIALSLVACVAIPLMCAFITVVYMHEHERQGGRTYVYTQHE